MPIAKRPVHGLDDENHRRRDREVMNQILDHTFDDSRVQTAAEVAAGVTPVNKAYAPGDARRYGVTGDGTTNDANAIQQAINVMAVYGGEVALPTPSVSYNLGTTGLTVPANVWVVGDASQQVGLTYSGTGFGIDLTGSDNGLKRMYIAVTNVAGNGIRFNGVSRFSGLDRVTVQCVATPAANRSGVGITHEARDADNAFSGNFLGQHVYSLGFIYGTRYIGFDSSVETWTTVTYLQTYNVGDAALMGSGSRGIWLDNHSNGVGTVYLGGGVELYATGILHLNGASCIGLFFRGDLEGNTLNWNLGESFCGVIEGHNAGDYISAGANGTANRWYREQHLSGQATYESYYGPNWLVYDESGNAARFEVFRSSVANSIISGVSTVVSKFAVQMHPSGTNTGERNWMELCGHKMAWGDAIPTVNAWGVGDVMWNTTVTAGGSPGWVCTTAGTPGTWKAMANVAP